MSESLPLSELVRLLLRCEVPLRAAHVFDAHASAGAPPHADLDVVVDAGRRLTLSELALLREAFEESALPMRIDVSDWHRLDAVVREEVVLRAIRVELGRPT